MTHGKRRVEEEWRDVERGRAGMERRERTVSWEKGNKEQSHATVFGV